MFTYKRVLKIAYALVIVCIVGILCLLWKERALSGIYGQYSALALIFVFVIYGGICIKRILKQGMDEEDIDKYFDGLDIQQLNNFHKNLKDCHNKISYIRHDMANHIQVYNNMKSSLGCEFPTKRLEEINEELAKHNTLKYCDDMLLDMAIEGKMLELRKQGYQVSSDIRLQNMERYQCERLCIYLWCAVDKITKRQKEGAKICIKMKNGELTSDGCIIRCSIEMDNRKPFAEIWEVKRKNV